MYMCFFPSSSLCAFSKRKRGGELVSKYRDQKKTGRRGEKARDNNFIEKERRAVTTTNNKINSISNNNNNNNNAKSQVSLLLI